MRTILEWTFLIILGLYILGAISMVVSGAGSWDSANTLFIEHGNI